jgi:CheY-like chemotaxis protein
MAATTHALRVLISDSSPDTARNLTMLVTQWGHGCKYATSSWQVLETVNSWKPEVVFLDAQMPVTNGYQLAKIIRARFAVQETGIVVMAERRTMAPPEHERFFDSLMLKPVAIAKVREAIESHAATLQS